MHIIEAKSISKTFTVTAGRKGMKGAVLNLFKPDKKQIHALDGVSFAVEKGEILGFLGPNGAGKSTMVKVLTGILTPTGGEAVVSEIVPYKAPRKNAMNIGVVFGQRSRLWWNLPVQDSLEYTKALYSIPDDVYEKNLSYFNESFGIEEILRKPVRTLSLGQKMRAEITMAMLHNPGILYLDEPTIGLDVVGKNELHLLVKRINEERGVTILLVTHDVLDIERLCSRVIIIDKGKLIWEGGTEQLKRAKGSQKHFHVLFESPCGEIKSPYIKTASIADGGARHEYLCEDADTPINEIISTLFAAGKVADLTITDAPLDHVMRRIYTE